MRNIVASGTGHQHNPVINSSGVPSYPSNYILRTLIVVLIKLIIIYLIYSTETEIAEHIYYNL